MKTDSAGQIVESNENNNFGQRGDSRDRAPITITPPPVDLDGYDTYAPASAQWGQAINVQSQIRRTGPDGAGPFQVQWYLSKDGVGSSDDILLNRTAGDGPSYAHPPIAAGSNYGPDFTVNLQLPPSLPGGWSGENFYVIMKTDSANEVRENNEGNNFGQWDTYDRDPLRITPYTGSTQFSEFSVADASGDETAATVFQGGALRLNYNLLVSAGSALANLTLEAVRSGSVATLATFAAANASNVLVNLANLANFTGGEYQVRAKAVLSNGSTIYSPSQALKVLALDTPVNGTYAGDALTYAAPAGTAAVVQGRSGTDTLNLGVAQSQVASINSVALSQFDPAISTASQAIYRGAAFDYVRLTDGREIYFQGIERLQFTDGVKELQVKTNDPQFQNQWNLHVSDVGGAWRFTTGSSNVTLVSLDAGIAWTQETGFHTSDLDDNRLKTDPSDDDNETRAIYLGHGHKSISVMSSRSNNGEGVAGINWVSPVEVTNVYGITVQKAISDALTFAQVSGQRVVFQGGFQGEWALTSGGSQQQLETLISNNENLGLFAIAAGNGGPGGNLDDPNYLTSVSGVAKLQTNHSNVMSVGALQRTAKTVDGLSNAQDYNLASYSNRGSNLTMVAATDSPAVNHDGAIQTFGGTSCANPNMAGIASLVWSANPDLTGPQVRQILIDTAMDLGDAGRDNTYGHGLVNADAAVRRAVALARSPDLAALYPSGSFSAWDASSSGSGFAGGSESASFVPPSATVAESESSSRAESALVLFGQDVSQQLARSNQFRGVDVDEVLPAAQTTPIVANNGPAALARVAVATSPSIDLASCDEVFAELDIDELLAMEA
jgi:hypothetical protein